MVFKLDLPPLAAVQEERISFVANFVYLGSAIDSGGRFFPGINRLLRIESSVMNSLNCRYRYLCRRTKIGLFWALDLLAWLSGSETWSIGAMSAAILLAL